MLTFIHLKSKFSQSSPDSIRLQGPSKRTSYGFLYSVSSVKELNRKGGKCTLSQVLDLSRLNTFLLVENGNTRVHQGVSDSRGMGYRTAIVNTFGPTGLHISQSSDFNRLLSRFHRDCSKSSRNLPKWNLSVVLNELTKAPFEPMKDIDLKHLTLKIAFLLALASCKRHSEIHAWVANKVSNLGQCKKVALFPYSDFIAKNQLAREGSQNVSPVTIPALSR